MKHQLKIMAYCKKLHVNADVCQVFLVISASLVHCEVVPRKIGEMGVLRIDETYELR